MTSPGSRIAHGAVAFAALLLLVIGVPAFLAVVVGWPLPHGTISVAGISDAFDGTTAIPDTFWFGALACLGWLMWLRVTIAVLAETRATIAGQPPSNHGVRRVIGPLVAAALLSVASTRPIRPAAAEPARPLPAAAAPQATATPTTQPAPAATAAPTWTVARNDSLWEIAERTLGDPMRWHDIYDLNQGRPQPDGGALSDPSLLRSGWTLQLPTDAAVTPAYAGAVTVEPGDTLSSIARRALGDADRYPELVAANAGVAQADGDRLQDPNLIRTGWQIEIPNSAGTAPLALPTEVPTEVPTPVAGPSDPPSTVPDAAANPLTSTSQSPPSTDEAVPSEDHQFETALVVAGLLSAGIVSAVGTARMRARRRRKPGDTVPAPSGVSADVEVRARRGAALHPPAPVAAGLSDLASTLPAAAQLDALSIASSGEVEVLLSEPVSKAPQGWKPDPTGRLLTAKCSGGVGEVSLSSPWLLCTLGTTGDREVLIDLARPTLTLIDGTEGEDVALFRTLMLAVATSPLGTCTDIIYVGRRRAPTLECVRALHGKDIADQLARIRHANCDPTLDATTPHSRTIVFLDARFVDEAVAADIAALADPALPVVVVGDQGRGAERVLTAESGTVSIKPAGLTVTAAATTDEIGDLWSLSESGGIDVELAPPGDMVTLAEAATDGVTRTQSADVLVRVLGAVRVEGAAERFSRRIAEEVVVYLALHRNGVDEARLKTALWPESAPATSSFNQAVSRARVALGTTTEGAHHLPHVAVDGLYRVGPSVASDVEVLESRLRDATHEPTSQSMADLGEEIWTVEGLPFAGTGAGYEWAHAEGLVGWAQALVSDAAHVLASWAIANGDAATALRATRSALLACPADEILYRDQMLAHDLAGNPAGVAASMRELLTVIEADVPQDSVHPDTLALYERLCPRARNASSETLS